MSDHPLARLSAATAALAQADTVDKAKRIREIAIAAQEYARAAKLGLEPQNRAAELKLRAERKAGGLLTQLEREDAWRGNQYLAIPNNGHSQSEYRAVLDGTGTSSQDASRWQTIAGIDDDVFEDWLERQWQAQQEITTAGALRFAKHPAMMVHYSSESPEWCTPPEVVELVEQVLGSIDLDPCSNAGEPNVPAARRFTWADDGLSQSWTGRVYMNPPYGRSIEDWVEKLAGEYEAGQVTEAIALLPARTDTAWIRRLRRYPRCFIAGRLSFSDTGTAPFPSVAVYLGNNLAKFVAHFGDIGDVYGLIEA